ncbi:hypothetical protein MKW92_014807 [Papaver armeniacum]|nr:hypothetical protein MKW92_014807 [Papaver armeniacum]
MGKLQLPVGYKFIPTDEQLIIHYLLPKVEGRTLNCYDYIFDVNNIYDYKDPSELFDEILQNSNGQDTSNDESDDQILYFFSTLKPLTAFKKSGRKKQRAVENGTWSGQTPPANIFSPGTENVIGCKRYYTFTWKDNPVTNAKRRKTDSSESGRWAMHEYSLLDSFYQDNNKKEYVICRIKRSKRGKRSFASIAPQLQPQSVPLVSKKPSPPVPVPGQSSSLPATSVYETGSSSSTQSSVYEVGSLPSTPSSANMEPLILMRGIHCDMNGFNYSSAKMEPLILMRGIHCDMNGFNYSAANMAPSIDKVQPQPLNSKAGLSSSQSSGSIVQQPTLLEEFQCGMKVFDYSSKNVTPGISNFFHVANNYSTDDEFALLLDELLNSPETDKEWNDDSNLESVEPAAAMAFSQPKKEGSGDDNLQSVAPTAMPSHQLGNEWSNYHNLLAIAASAAAADKKISTMPISSHLAIST